MKVSRDLYNLNLLAKLIVLLHQISFNLAIAAISEVIQMWISAEHVPSLHGVTPRYLKLVTSSDFRLFMVISTLMLFVLLAMTLLHTQSFVLCSK